MGLQSLDTDGYKDGESVGLVVIKGEFGTDTCCCLVGAAGVFMSAGLQCDFYGGCRM